jgi:hypothetical protein
MLPTASTSAASNERRVEVEVDRTWWAGVVRQVPRRAESGTACQSVGDRAGVGHVGDDRECGTADPADLVDRRLYRRRVQIPGGDRQADLRRSDRDCAADPAARAGHDQHVAGREAEANRRDAVGNGHSASQTGSHGRSSAC